jgi:hypothetical protein
MKTTKCRVGYEELLDFRDGRAEPPAAETLSAHLAAGCESCQTQLAQIDRLQSVMLEGELSSAPAHVLDRVKGLFRERFEKPARRSLFAQLVFDSRSRLALSGARGAETGQIQVLYSTSEHDIDLWQERTPDGNWYVIGQVMPKEGGGPVQPASAFLRSARATIESTEEGSEFHLAAIPAGSYALQIALPDVDVEVDGVTIGA